MSKSPFNKVKSEMRITEKIALLIPGFRGYKEKELRREADKLVRNYIDQQLMLSKDDLRVVFQRIVDNKLNDLWTDIDRLITNLDTVASEINHASYGYSGFFDAVKIQERNLDAMINYDQKLIDNIKSLDAEIKQFKDEALNGNFENARTRIKEIRSSVDQLDKLYNERKNVILDV